MSNAPALGAVVHRRSQTTISLRGELDLYSVDALRRMLYDPGCRSRVTVDLTDTTFVDSSTLTQLLRFHRWLDRRGSSLTILCPKREIRRVFELTGLDHVLTIEPSPPIDLSELRIDSAPHAA
jgi:anti-sigma B factor antagonist